MKKPYYSPGFFIYFKLYFSKLSVMNRRLFLILFTGLLIISCTNDHETDPTVDGAVSLDQGYTPHPQPDKMAHPDITPEVAELKDPDDIPDYFPAPLTLLYSFINDIEYNSNKKELSVLTSSHHSFHAASIDSETLVFLDESDERLIQYDLTNGEYENLAPRGRGPGDILFPRAMQMHDQRIYIGMQGFRISIFNCRPDTCKFERTINTDYNNYSVAPSDKQLAVLGLPRFGHEGDTNPENIDQKIIHILNEEDEPEYSFSRAYQHLAPIVREQMNSNGNIEAFPLVHTYVLTHNFYPYIYLYNFEGSFLNKIRIPNFKQGYYDFSERERIGQFRHNDNTNIAHTTKIDEEWLLLHLRNRKNMDWTEDGLSGKEWVAYYAFNVKSREIYNIGDDEIQSTATGSTRNIFPTDHGLVINQSGELFWIGI
jgi:hypothetical protein